MSEFENPALAAKDQPITVEDVRALCGAATPHFALQVRGRLQRLVAGLPPSDPARKLAEDEMARLQQLAVEGQRGNRDSDLPHLTHG